ncbi:MAG: ATP-dependent helicase, partial [Planctomycetota bacterium]
ALLKRKLNYQLIGGFRFYHRQEIRDLLAYLRLVNNPTDDISFKRIINVPPRGLGEKTLGQVTELARNREIPMLVALRAAIDRGMLSRKAQTGAKQFLDLYDKLVTQSSESIVAMLQTLLEETKSSEYLAGKKSEAPDESIEGNVQELISDAAEVDLINEEGSALQQFLEQVSLSSDTDSLTSDDRVTLMTLHSAKGLEFAHVYIIAIEQDILPHARSRHHNDQLEEERRLFFVGITRAKETLHLSNAMTRGFGNNQMAAPSPFLMELPRAEMSLADGSDSYASDDGLDDSWGDSWGDGSESEIPQPLQRKNKRARETSWKSFPKMHSGSEIIAAATLAGVPVDDFEAGMRVRHPAYGQGTILSTEGFGPKRMVRIDFDQGDRKSFQLSKSPLELA